MSTENWRSSRAPRSSRLRRIAPSRARGNAFASIDDAKPLSLFPKTSSAAAATASFHRHESGIAMRMIPWAQWRQWVGANITGPRRPASFSFAELAGRPLSPAGCAGLAHSSHVQQLFDNEALLDLLRRRARKLFLGPD